MGDTMNYLRDIITKLQGDVGNLLLGQRDMYHILMLGMVAENPDLIPYIKSHLSLKYKTYVPKSPFKGDWVQELWWDLCDHLWLCVDYTPEVKEKILSSDTRGFTTLTLEGRFRYHTTKTVPNVYVGDGISFRHFPTVTRVDFYHDHSRFRADRSFFDNKSWDNFRSLGFSTTERGSRLLKHCQDDDYCTEFLDWVEETCPSLEKLHLKTYVPTPSQELLNNSRRLCLKFENRFNRTLQIVWELA
jgi:hypothetical protein